MGISFAVPVIVIIIVLGNYLHGRVLLAVQKRNVADYEERTEKLSYALKLQEDAQREIAVFNACLEEVADTIGGHIQWSPILQALAENMPKSLVLEELDVATQIVQKEVPKRNEPSITIKVPVPRNVLRIDLYGRLRANTDETILRFQQGLRNSSVASPIVDNIRMVSQKADEKKGIMHYSIECIFEPG